MLDLSISIENKYTRLSYFMDFSANFPLIFWLNLGRRDDRRSGMERRLHRANISAERFPAIDSRNYQEKWEKSSGSIKGYESPGRYSLALTKRLAVREAKRRKSNSVLLLEDDVIFHPNFKCLVSSIDVPDDWQILYFGCAHTQSPTWVGPRVVRVRNAVDNHAVAIHRDAYNEVLKIWNRTGKQSLEVPEASDQYLATLASKLPTYAIYPNLAWQSHVHSDLIERKYSNYSSDGDQTWTTEAINSLFDEYFSHRSNTSPKLGLLFLTRGDVNHPDIWKEFVGEAPGHVRIFTHAKYPEELVGGFLASTDIKDRVDTDWGDISLVKATLLLLKEALADESITHFMLLSESCVPIMPLPEILRRLEMDGRSRFTYVSYANATSTHHARVAGVATVPEECWRFQPQWWLFDRNTARFASDQDFTDTFSKMLAPDEYYFATIMSVQGYPIDNRVARAPITWTHWIKGHGSPVEWSSMPQDKFLEMVNSGSWFARKFTPESDIGSKRLHTSRSYLRWKW